MKRLLFEKLILMGIFLVFYFLIELITFSWLGLSVLPEYLLIDLVIAIVFASIALLMKSHRASIAYLSTILFIFAIIALTNQTMNIELNGEIFSVYQLLYADEAVNVFTADFIHWDAIVTLIAVGIIYGLTIRYSKKAFFKKYHFTKGYHLKVIPLYLVTLLVGVTGINMTKTFTHYNDLYNVSLFKRESINHYGMMGFYFKEVDILLFDAGSRLYELEDLEDNFVNENPNLYNESDLLIPYAGLLEGKNVITIMLESGQGFAVNEVLTPNLHRVTTEGLYFPNHYSENKTNVSEVIGILGHYPSQGIIPSYYHYDFRASMPYVLEDEGYHTAYFHENVETFYARGDLMPELGFEDIYLHQELFPDELIYGWGGDYTLDSRTMLRMFDFMFKEDSDEPFYYFWSTLSMHGPYNRNYPSVRGKNNLQKFTDLGYFDQIDQAEENGQWTNIMADSPDDADPGRFRFYQAAVMDFDVALGLLLDRLEEENLLDDTIIMIYGDHNLYYHQMHLRIHDVEAGDIHETDMYKTFFAIYNPILTNAYLSNHPGEDTSIEKFVTPYDILPTYYHLLGIEYYKNFTLGESVLTDRQTVFYSHKISAFFNETYFSFDDETIDYPQGINVNDDLDALSFILKARDITDKILWLELWTDVTKTEKNN